MAKNRKEAYKGCLKIIEDKFSKAPYTMRKSLFEQLETWARTELVGEQQDIFLEALYNAPITLEIRLEIGLDKVLNKGDNK